MTSPGESDGSARTPTGQFAKGVSGNRRGRPRKKERAYTQSQIRHDILGLMEKEIDIKVKGKNKPMPIILAVYWRMLLKAVEGDDRMMLAVIALRNELMKEHREANFDLVQAIDDIEINLTRDGHVLDDETLKSLNEARRRTRGSS